MVVVALPRPGDLHDARLHATRCGPHRFARRLLAEAPHVAVLGDAVYGHDPPTCVLAGRLVAGADAMHHLLAAHLGALDEFDRIADRNEFDLLF